LRLHEKVESRSRSRNCAPSPSSSRRRTL
jgi:hypothetical protein